MALFKLRKKVDEPVAAASPAESIEAMRRRARHRLIGAVVLVLVGVVGFPLLFDTQPRPVPVDIPIEIPDRNKVKPLPPLPQAPVAQGRVKTLEVPSTRVTTEPCDCGRTHLRIMRITGRNDDMLIIRGVNVYPSQVEAVIVGRPQLAPHYQLVVTREGVLDEVQVEIEAQPGVSAADYPQLARELSHAVKVQCGISTRVTVLEPGKVARSQGKAVRVRDLRKL